MRAGRESNAHRWVLQVSSAVAAPVAPSRVIRASGSVTSTLRVSSPRGATAAPSARLLIIHGGRIVLPEQSLDGRPLRLGITRHSGSRTARRLRPRSGRRTRVLSCGGGRRSSGLSSGAEARRESTRTLTPAAGHGRNRAYVTAIDSCGCEHLALALLPQLATMHGPVQSRERDVCSAACRRT
jgi:hypothetical protein